MRLVLRLPPAAGVAGTAAAAILRRHTAIVHRAGKPTQTWAHEMPGAVKDSEAPGTATAPRAAHKHRQHFLPAADAFGTVSTPFASTLDHFEHIAIRILEEESFGLRLALWGDQLGAVLHQAGLERRQIVSGVE